MPIQNIEFKGCFEYELSAVPYSIAHLNGSLRKGATSKLSLELEKETVVSEKLPPSEGKESTSIVDGVAILQMIKFLPALNLVIE